MGALERLEQLGWC